MTLSGGDDGLVLLIRVVGGLLLCGALAVAAALLIKRFGLAGLLTGKGLTFAKVEPSARSLKVLETRRISTHADVCRLTCGDREYLVVVTPGGAVKLDEIAAKTEPAA